MSEFQQRSRQSTDSDILSEINSMVEAEKHLRDRIASGQAESGQAQQDLAALEVRLDQCWDLLRQRRARTEYGENPDEARVRPAAQVEGYES
ncbi:DUF2630 family protein [Kitasatospora sp. MAP5-34]|uniref:DUF2630 family protein n=1 Tax=Kitasatospora sp. MAP5-34 TaxID=3035102 RepID=UPI002475E0DC|nr:DUF2630 family protein [Kitasatospora sp. MAP5-34]MDH6579985.1 primosomal protein N'' [Kitasatospora sp. MAP5-34]